MLDEETDTVGREFQLSIPCKTNSLAPLIYS